MLNLTHMVSFMKCSITNMPFPEGYFDKCLLNCTLEHIPDDMAALREVNRALRPGGSLVLTVPTDFEMQKRVSPRLAKALLSLPRSLRSMIGSRPLIEADSLYKYCNLVIADYDHARFGYSHDDIVRKLNDAGFQVMVTRHYFQTFASIPVDLMDGLSCFELNKGGKFGYSAKHEWLFGLCFPVFYAIAMADRLLPSRVPALGLAVVARKQVQVSAGSSDNGA